MNEFIKLLERKGVDFTLDGDNLTVGGSLYLQDCTGITALPDNLTVGGYLDLRGTGITALPDNLTVGGSLDLRGTGITALPDNLSVGGSLDLDAKRISNIAFRENCGYSSRTIFAAWNDNNFKISAGCFFDTLDKFE